MAPRSARQVDGSRRRARSPGDLPSAPAPAGAGSRRQAGPHRAQAPSSRYTPPVPRSVKQSPRWVPVLMFGLLVLGAIVIVLNYLELLPGAASNWYLLGGLGLILGGIFVATQYR